MIAAGAPIVEVQQRLGHANPAITLQIYAHLLKPTESAVADRLADFVLQNPGSPTEIGNCGHSRWQSGCGDPSKCLINKAWRRKRPGGLTGLQNASRGFSYVVSGYAVSKIAPFSAVEITLGYAVEAGSGHSVGTRLLP